MARPKSEAKITASLSMTPKAWAVLHQLVTDRNTTKSAYVESLVMSADNRLYDEIIEFVFTQHKFTARKVQQIQKQLDELKEYQEASRKFLIKIGVHPSKIEAD